MYKETIVNMSTMNSGNTRGKYEIKDVRENVMVTWHI